MILVAVEDKETIIKGVNYPVVAWGARRFLRACEDQVSVIGRDKSGVISTGLPSVHRERALKAGADHILTEDKNELHSRNSCYSRY